MASIEISLYQEKINCSIEQLTQKIRTLINPALDAEIFYRVKNEKTLKQKIVLKKAPDVFSIHDVYAIRIIVNRKIDAYTIFENLKKQLRTYSLSDFIKNPIKFLDPGFEGKSFKCLRIVAYENDAPFEIQITTKKFHKVNEAQHEVFHLRVYGE